MNSILTNKKILITGGTGSIGTSLVKRAILDKAKLIKVFSNDENGLYDLELEIGKLAKIEFIIGDVRNSESVCSAANDIDLIFHAAALKHVDRCELFPLETTSINVIGTNNIVKAAIQNNVQKVICISTDKAVNPIGVMGATKLLAEKIMSSQSIHSKSNPIFASVRFGNVFHTRGSILPRIENQIKNGGPVTLTDERMKRFFMTRDDAVELIIQATKLAKGSEIFILKMPLLKLKDLFDSMKIILGPRYRIKPEKISTKIIGIRPGEKLTEFLLTNFEMEHALETKNFFIIPNLFEKVNLKNYPGSKKPKNLQKYLQQQKSMTKNEIIKLLKQTY